MILTQMHYSNPGENIIAGSNPILGIGFWTHSIAEDTPVFLKAWNNDDVTAQHAANCY